MEALEFMVWLAVLGWLADLVRWVLAGLIVLTAIYLVWVCRNWLHGKSLLAPRRRGRVRL